MINWIIENWELYLLISSLPFLILYPLSKYLNKKADKKLISDLREILMQDDKENLNR